MKQFSTDQFVGTEITTLLDKITYTNSTHQIDLAKLFSDQDVTINVFFHHCTIVESIFLFKYDVIPIIPVSENAMRLSPSECLMIHKLQLHQFVFNFRFNETVNQKQATNHINSRLGILH